MNNPDIKGAIAEAVEALNSCSAAPYAHYFDEHKVEQALTKLRAFVEALPDFDVGACEWGMTNALYAAELTKEAISYDE